MEQQVRGWFSGLMSVYVGSAKGGIIIILPSRCVQFAKGVSS
jgi:hypothetical protein